jgi:hypothetical protein
MQRVKIVFCARNLLKSIGLAFVMSIACSMIATAQADKIPRELKDRLATDETVLVLVGLNVSWQQEGSLSDDAIQAQRQAIGSVQDDLLSELSGTKYKIIRQYQVIPSIALEVGADALSVLEKSDRVTNVLSDRPARPAENQGTSASPPSTARSTGAARDAARVPTELFKEAASDGTVLVLVGLRAPWRPEGPLSEKLVAAQREAIAAAQNYLLTELAGTKYEITRRYRRIPGIALKVGLDALKVLARSAAVTSVLKDRPAKPFK